jgi:hypothetical protein
MLRLGAPRERYLIDDGRVFCPVRGHDIEVDLCAGCRLLAELKPDATPPFVRCRAAASASPLQ